MNDERVTFDLFEANAAIPRLEMLFAELARIQRQADVVVARANAHGIEISDADAGAPDDRASPLKAALVKRLRVLSESWAEAIGEMAALGVVVEDVEQGMVRFPAQYEGDEIVLSWQYGEPEVGHWYAPGEDAGARRPLETLLVQRPLPPMRH